MFLFRGRLVCYVFLGVFLGLLYSLHSLVGKRHGKRVVKPYHVPNKQEMDDAKILRDRAPVVFNKQKQELNRQLIASDLPQVGHVPGNDTEAEKLFHSVRVICWIPTSPYLFFKRSIYVLQTWGKRCNKLFFFVSKSMKDPEGWQRELKGGLITDLDHNHYSQQNLEFIEMDTMEKGSWDLTKKVFTAWKHIYDHHLNDADWFIKVDDDTYVIMENLRKFLSDQDPNDPVYFGHRFLVAGKDYHSGGAGYVMSRQTLELLSENYESKCKLASGVEDMQMGTCLNKLGVRTGEAMDEQDRSYFYPLGPVATLTGKYPKWYTQYDKKSKKHQGIIGFPRMPISFHYVGQQKMLELELFIYYIQVYGGILAGADEKDFSGGIINNQPMDDDEEEELDDEENRRVNNNINIKVVNKRPVKRFRFKMVNGRRVMIPMRNEDYNSDEDQDDSDYDDDDDDEDDDE